MPFAEIYGHRTPIDILRQCLVQGRLPHAFLFHGIPGTGKLKTATALAQGINCNDSNSRGDGCGQCSSCRKIEEGTHPDFFLLKPEGQFIRIDRVREIIERMAFKPMQGRAHFFILTQAERMNVAAANALLKTLEEPRPDNIIVLITSRLHHLPRTVVSRCRPLGFNPLPIIDVARYLRDKRELSSELAEEIALRSGGSIGRALDILSQRQKGRAIDLTSLLEDHPSASGPTVYASLFGQEREEIIENLLELKILFRDALVCKIKGADTLPKNLPGREAILSWANRFDSGRLLSQIDLIDRGIAAIEQNANKQLTLEALLFKLAR